MSMCVRGLAFLAALASAVGGSRLLITTTSPLPDATAGSGYSLQFQATPGFSPYNWFSQPAPPNGLTLSASGLLSGTPTSLGTFSFTVFVDGGDFRAQGTFMLTVRSDLRITTSSLPNPSVGVAYSQGLTANGGVTPYSWGISSGFLPPGLSINSVTGVIGGTASVANSFTFTVQVTDALQSIASQSITLTVTTPITFLTNALGNGIVGVAYSQQIDASGGAPPFMFSLGNAPPPGLTFTASGNTSASVTGKPTAAGVYALPVMVVDVAGTMASKTYSITISAPQAPLLVSPTALTFTASSAGDSPGSQIVTVLSAGTTAAGFTLIVDGGQANTPAPPWLKVTPSAGTTPAVLVVSVDPSGLNPGSFTGRIRVGPPNATVPPPIDVTVTLTVASAPPKLAVATTFLRFAALSSSPGMLDQTIIVRNAGGSGAEGFSVTTPVPIPWLDSITPNAGQSSPNNPVFVRVRVNTTGLAKGGHKGVLRFSSPDTIIDVPISVFVAAAGPIIGVDQTGVRFEARQGQGVGPVKTIQVLDTGDAGSRVNFTASLVNTANWLTISPASGSATPTQPGALKLSINGNAQTLAPGGYYAVVQITDSNSHNSPQFVVVVLDIGNANRPVAPDLSPPGLVFPASGNQIVTAGVSSSQAVNFTVSPATTDGGVWLSASPATGSASSANSAAITVSANSTGLKAGVYTGLVNVAIGTQVRSVNVTLIVPPGTGAAAAGPEARATSACTATRVVVTQTGEPTNFSVPAGWPATLSINMNDDCANPLANGSAFASFSNGDPPLSLHPNLPGLYSATWQPSNSMNNMTVTVRGSSGSLQPGSTQITGGVTPNVTPVLFPNGTINNYYAASALSPGLIAQVYGSGLAASVGQPGSLPLPGTFQGTSVMIGSKLAPLYYVSSGQVNVEIPAESPTDQQTILVSANNAYTLPDVLDINPLQAGIAAYADGSNNAIAQHADFSYVDAGHPAKPSEVVIIYLAGMGATNPAVPSGQGAPTAEPLARVVNPPTVTVDGQNAPVQFAGLAPAFVGLYQIDLQVPSGARSGSLPLVVSQNGVAGNTTNLIVK